MTRGCGRYEVMGATMPPEAARKTQTHRDTEGNVIRCHVGSREELLCSPPGSVGSQPGDVASERRGREVGPFDTISAWFVPMQFWESPSAAFAAVRHGL